MHSELEFWKTILTNGEIDIDLYYSRTGCSFDIPEGHIFSEDSKGNMWLDGKPLYHKIIRVF